MMAGPLAGIQILDFTRAMTGPFCTQLLGDMGAQVVKVEMPGGGDETRRWGPFWNGHSCYYLSANRNKRSIAIDLKRVAGREIATTLASQSDVVIENFRPGIMDRLGLGYEALAKRNPGLVYCCVSGFGQDGPRAQEPAYDLMMQGFAGLMGLTGFADGPPVRAGLPVADLTAAIFAAFGIVAALFSRAEDGRGQKVETSLLEGQVSWLSYYMVGYLANGEVMRGMGSAHHSLTPYKAYHAQDEYFVLAVGNDALWQRLCEAIDAPDLVEDPRFVTNVERLANRDALDEILDQVFIRLPAAEWIERISAAGVPCGPINGLDQIAADPQVRHTQMIQAIPHPEIPDLELCGIPVKFGRTPGAIQSPPPLLGEHTEAILSELGYSAEQIAALHRQGVVESPERAG
jgi:crotonobetainyl-CoA:carnitine CoA-transferase CaiB-like acyl-CoA transferase